MPLAELQREFHRHVVRPGRSMPKRVVSTATASAVRRLGIYVHAYSARLVEALASDFEALQKLLGDAQFGSLMRDFIAARPSRHANVRWYGAELAAFARRSQRWSRRPVLAELADFEWALGLVFDAADAGTVSVEDVARVPAQAWRQLRFELHPSVRRLRLSTNAPALWQAVRKGKALPRVARARAPVDWLLWRRKLTPLYRSISADEAWAIDAIVRGRSFAALCSGLRRFVGEENAAPRAAQLLKTWVGDALIATTRVTPRA